MNTETARTQARLNRADTYTPFGNVTYTELPGDRWRTDVSLSPQQQTIYQQGADLSQQGGRLALDLLPAARDTLMQPMAMDDADARDRATAGIMSRLEPQFARDREALEGRLLSQGFQPGTEAYQRAADELNRTVTDARMQAVTAGSQESRAAAQFANAQRAQRINELGMVFGLGPGVQVPQSQDVAQVGLNSPDLMSGIYNNYQTQSQMYGANMGALGQLGGSALAALLMRSDRRVKRDICRVGTLDNGLPVYLFRYAEGGPMQIGVMAQDVEVLHPEAVAEIDGVKHVDYAQAVA